MGSTPRLPGATALSALCSAEPTRWPPLPPGRSSVCAPSSSSVFPCKPRGSPADSRPVEASAPWSSCSTEGPRNHTHFVIFKVWAGTPCLYDVGQTWTFIGISAAALRSPAADGLWWRTAVWPTGPATSSSTGRRRAARPSSAQWRPPLTATGVAQTATSPWSLPPHRTTRTSCSPPRHRLSNQDVRFLVQALVRSWKGTNSRGTRWTNKWGTDDVSAGCNDDLN